MHIPPKISAELAVAKDVMQQQEEMARALARIKELEAELRRTESLASLKLQEAADAGPGAG